GLARCRCRHRAVSASDDPGLLALGRRPPAATATPILDQHVPAAGAPERNRRGVGPPYSGGIRSALPSPRGTRASQGDAGDRARKWIDGWRLPSMGPVAKLLQLWRRRYWRADREALAAYAGLRPFTVVTGGSEGIGLALARRFAAAGNDVLLVARR